MNSKFQVAVLNDEPTVDQIPLEAMNLSLIQNVKVQFCDLLQNVKVSARNNFLRPQFGKSRFLEDSSDNCIIVPTIAF